MAVTANAVAITRGSCRAGSRKRPVSGATASQPTKDSMSVDAARPTEAQPCGANGVQLAACAAGADPATATTATAISSATRISCAVVVARTPTRARPSTASRRIAATAEVRAWPPPVRLVT